MRAAILSAAAAPRLVLSVALPSRAQAQDRVVQGTVRDNTSAALPGASIRVNNTTVGTTADVEGHFSLSVPKGSDVLQVNFVGLSPQEITIGNRTSSDVVLNADGQSLNEVVVIGYGWVASIKSAELLVGTPVSLDRGLQGQVAGVLLTFAEAENEVND